MTLGEEVIKYRKEHDLSLRQFAELCDLSPAQITFIENGRDGKPIIPKIDTLLKITKATGITFDLTGMGPKLANTEDFRYLENLIHAMNKDQLHQLRVICEERFPLQKILIENGRRNNGSQ